MLTRESFMKVCLFSDQNFDLKIADISDNEFVNILDINNDTNFDKLLFSINKFSQRNLQCNEKIMSEYCFSP